MDATTGSAIQVKPCPGAHLAKGVEGIRATSPEQVITAIFRHPVTGEDLPVLVTLFQNEDLRLMGAGVYMAGRTGQPVRGTVLRWDAGPEEDPVIITWQAPHCADDECGSPCGHVDR